jgi:hypothetical protein
MTKSKDEIPEEFETIEQIQDFWDTHSTADYWDEMEDVEMELSPKLLKAKSIESIAVYFLKQKIKHFEYFTRVAELKACVTNKDKAQYKVEGWLKAELIVYLLRIGLEVVPEYKVQQPCKYTWDIYIKLYPKKQSSCFLALKCLANSIQTVSDNSEEWQKVKKDLDTIVKHNLNQGQAYLALILSSSFKCNHLERHRQNMLKFIEQYQNQNSGKLHIQKYFIPFKFHSKEGIELVWIEKNS